MKRMITRIVQNDYTSKEDFEKDVPVMKKKGYTLIKDGMYGDIISPGKTNDEEWEYTAHFYKSFM